MYLKIACNRLLVPKINRNINIVDLKLISAGCYFDMVYT